MPARERGTTLLLFPGALLVVMVLGTIAVDLGSVLAARRELVRVVGAAADDAAARLDLDAVRAGRPIRIDLAAAREQVLVDLALADLPGRAVGAPVVTLGPAGDTVVVEVTRDIPHIVGRAVPGVPDAERVTVRLSGSIAPP